MSTIESEFRDLFHMASTPTLGQVGRILAGRTDEEHRALLERVVRRGSRWHEHARQAALPEITWCDVAVVAEFARPAPSLGQPDAVEVGIPCERHGTHVERFPRGLGPLPHLFEYAPDHDVLVVVTDKTPRRPARRATERN